VRVLEWVRANEGGLFDTSKITIGGFSAGGNLALAVAGSGAREGELKGVVAFYPAADYSVRYADLPPPPLLKLESMNKGTVITAADGQRFYDSYLCGLPYPYPEATLRDPRLSPVYAVPKRFPDKGRTMVLTCEYDYLNTTGNTMARALKEGGREPVVELVKGLGHGWDIFCQDGTEEAGVRDLYWRKAVAVIRRAQGNV
jgi:acetyl esterase/lipase